MGLQGIVRGRAQRTTISDKAAPCALDRVNRDFKAKRPNALWLADFTYIATWAGFVHVAFVSDAFARRIVGWRVARSTLTGFVLDALELIGNITLAEAEERYDAAWGQTALAARRTKRIRLRETRHGSHSNQAVVAS